MKAFFSMPVQQQLTLTVGLLCLALIGVFAGGTAYFGRQQAVEIISDQAADLAETMAYKLDRGMSERFREVRNLAALDPIRDAWEVDPARIRTMLDGMQASYPEYAWIGFATVDGNVKAAAKGMLEGQSVASRPWFQAGLKAPSVGNVHEAKLLSTLLGTAPDSDPFRFVDLSAPVLDRSNKVVGVLGAHLSWGWADRVRRDMLNALRSTQGAEIWILSQDGEILLGPEIGSRPFDAKTWSTIQNNGRGSFQSKAASATTLIGYSKTTGYRDYPGLDWTVIARQPAATAFARANELLGKDVALASIVAIAGILLASLVARTLARPIGLLTVAAHAIGRDPHASMPSLSGSREVVELSSALRSLLRRIGHAEEEVQHAREQSDTSARSFKEEIGRLKRLADIDPLTGLLNRRAFLTVSEDAMTYFQRYGRTIAVLILDIDFFKRINDQYGHAVGDAVIRNVGEVLSGSVRGTDKVARFGGEEFVVLLREIGEDGVCVLAERMRNSIRRSIIVHDNHPISVTVSIGAALASDTDADIQDLIERADRALYQAKNGGRNAVVFSNPVSRIGTEKAA